MQFISKCWVLGFPEGYACSTLVCTRQRLHLEHMHSAINTFQPSLCDFSIMNLNQHLSWHDQKEIVRLEFIAERDEKKAYFDRAIANAERYTRELEEESAKPENKGTIREWMHIEMAGEVEGLKWEYDQWHDDWWDRMCKRSKEMGRVRVEEETYQENKPKREAHLMKVLAEEKKRDHESEEGERKRQKSLEEIWARDVTPEDLDLQGVV